MQRKETRNIPAGKRITDNSRTFGKGEIMLVDINKILKKADSIVKAHGTRNPLRLAQSLDITVLSYNFGEQKGAYKVVLKNRFIFINKNLDDVTRNIVIMHEIAHDTLHRKTAIESGGFEEYSIFDIQDRQMEYEANIFASHVLLPDDEILEHIKQGYDVDAIAKIMNTDRNLVAIKADILIEKGYKLRRQTYCGNFLK